MGSWDHGLYDNDSALDTLGEIFDEVEAELENSPAHLIVGLGLIAWMNPSRIGVRADAYRALMERRRDWIEAAPSAARDRLRALAEDPRAFTKDRRARSERITEVLGGYCDGPREDALLTVPGASSVIEDLAERCRVRLDEMGCRDLHDAMGDLAPLGVLLELEAHGTAAKRVAAWRRAFDRACRESEDRDDFAEYVVRARKGLVMLAAAGGARSS